MLSVLPVYAQESWDIIWERAYNLEGDDLIRAGVVDGSDYVFAGVYEPFYESGFVMKVDGETGDTIWVREFGLYNYYDDFRAITRGPGGIYWVAGATRSYDVSGDYDFWLLKLDSNGDSLAGYAYGGSDVDRAYDVAVDGNGDVVLVGRTRSYGAGNNDIWIVKVNSFDGSMVWSSAYGGSGYDYGHAVSVDSSGNYIVVGRWDNGSNLDGWILKIDSSSGDTLWSRKMGGSANYDAFYDVLVDGDGNYVVVGYSRSYTPDNDFWIVKLSPSGSLIWQKFYDAGGEDYAYSVALDTSGYYVVVGNSGGDALVMKVEASTGDTMWTHKYIEGNGIYEDNFTVMVDGNGNYVSAGLQSNSDYDAWILKIYGITDMIPPVIDSLTQLPRDADGTFGPYEVWAWIMDNRTGVETALLHWKKSTQPAFFVDTMSHVSGNWYMGSIPQQSAPSDSVRMMYFVTAEDSMGNVSSSDTLSFWIVNPSISRDESMGEPVILLNDINGGVRISLQIRGAEHLSLEIFDANGRRVEYYRGIVNGVFRKDFSLAPGIYFLNIHVGGYTFNRKIISIR